MIRATVLLLLYAIGASAQTLTPVTAAASNGWPWWIGPAIGIAIVAVVLIWLKVKKPATAAAVQTTVSADVAALTAAVHKLVEHSSAPLSAAAYTSETTTTTTPAPDLQPALDAANGKLAQIKAILDA